MSHFSGKVQEDRNAILLLKIFCFCFGCAGSLLLHAGFLWLWQSGAILVAVHRLPVEVASLVERRLRGCGSQA